MVKSGSKFRTMITKLKKLLPLNTHFICTKLCSEAFPIQFILPLMRRNKFQGQLALTFVLSHPLYKKVKKGTMVVK